jgi:hypothetical protein
MSPKATRAVQDAARRIVRERDGHRCQMCSRSIVDFPSNVHHRINRGSGGSAKLERASLLIRICGSGTTYCHGWVTEHARKGDRCNGWVLPKLNADVDPTQEPILLFDGWHLLDDEGNRTPCAPPRIPYLGETG